MPEKTGDKENGLGKVLKNPLVLIGGGAIVLYVLLKGGGSSGGGTDAATATAVQQALSDQQKAVTDALSQQSKDNADQLAQNSAALADALKMQQSSAPPPVTTPDTSELALIQQLQAQLNALTGKVNAQPANAGASTDPFPLAGTIAIGPDSPGARSALTWANGAGLPYEWGLAFLQHYGRLPSNPTELDHWFAELGNTTSDGQRCIAGHCVPGPGYVKQGNWGT